MIVKPYAARNLLLEAKRRRGLDHVQVSDTASFCLAQALETVGRAWAESAFEALGEDNLERGRLRMDDLKRLTDEHVEEALNGES